MPSADPQVAQGRREPDSDEGRDRAEHGDHAPDPPRELTVLRSWTFAPDDVELIFYVEAAYILGLLMKVENHLDDAGVRSVTVTTYVETDAIKPTRWRHVGRRRRPALASSASKPAASAATGRRCSPTLAGTPATAGSSSCSCSSPNSAAGEGGTHLTWFAESFHTPSPAS